MAVASSRERGELRRYKMTPLSPMAFLFSDVIMYFLISAVGMVIVLLIGTLAYGCDFTGDPLLFVYGFTLSGLSMFSIGLLIASLSKNAKIAQTVGMVIGFPHDVSLRSGNTCGNAAGQHRQDRKGDAAVLLRLHDADIWEGLSFSDLSGTAWCCCACRVFTLLTAITFKWD